MTAEHFDLRGLAEIPRDNPQTVTLTPELDGVVVETENGTKFGLRVKRTTNHKIGIWVICPKNIPIIFSDEKPILTSDTGIGIKDVSFNMESRQYAYISREIQLKCNAFDKNHVEMAISAENGIAKMESVKREEDIKALLEQATSQ